jgi:hypothetical protein
MLSAAIKVAQIIQNASLCFRVNAVNIYYIVDSDVCTSTPQSEGILAFPWQGWLGERAKF